MAEEKAAQIVTERVSEIRCRGCKTVLDVSAIDPFTRISCPNCGAEKTVPATLGNYALLERIGTGGMGAVYRGTDIGLDREVAIKVLLASMGSDERVVENFNQEAKAAARLNHPNVAQIYAFGQAQEQPYIVMEFIAGKSLKELMVPDKYLDEAFVMKTGLDIASGLNAAAAIGLLHGDVKPENILFDEAMEAKLIDFGLATFSNQEAADGIWGSPYYISPEKVRQQEVNERSDIYSLGGTLYHALCGRPPFDGETAEEVVKKRLKLDPKDLSQRRSDISPEVEQIVMRMLKRSPGERYPNYRSLSSDLRSVVDELNKSVTRRTARQSSKSARIYSDVVPKAKRSSGRVHTSRTRAATGGRTQTSRTRAATGRRHDTVIQRDTGGARRTARPGASSRDLSRHAPSKPRSGDGDKPQPAQKSNKGLIIGAVGALAVVGIIVGAVVSQKGGSGGGGRASPGRKRWSNRHAPKQPGGILFSEGFASRKTDMFTSPLGYWMLQSGRYCGFANNDGEWTVALIKHGKQLPASFRVGATVRTRTMGKAKNGVIVFDYINPKNFKYAGMFDGTDEWVIGLVTEDGMKHQQSLNETIDTGKDYKIEAVLSGSGAKLLVNGVEKLSHDYGGGTVADGQVGIGSRSGHSSFDNITITQ